MTKQSFKFGYMGFNTLFIFTLVILGLLVYLIFSGNNSSPGLDNLASSNNVVNSKNANNIYNTTIKGLISGTVNISNYTTQEQIQILENSITTINNYSTNISGYTQDQQLKDLVKLTTLISNYI